MVFIFPPPSSLQYEPTLPLVLVATCAVHAESLWEMPSFITTADPPSAPLTTLTKSRKTVLKLHFQLLFHLTLTLIELFSCVNWSRGLNIVSQIYQERLYPSVWLLLAVAYSGHRQGWKSTTSMGHQTLTGHISAICLQTRIPPRTWGENTKTTDKHCSWNQMFVC